MERIFYFAGRAGDLLPAIKHHIAPPDAVHFASEHCPDHWNNIIIFGSCWKHHKNV